MFTIIVIALFQGLVLGHRIPWLLWPAAAVMLGGAAMIIIPDILSVSGSGAEHISRCGLPLAASPSTMGSPLPRRPMQLRHCGRVVPRFRTAGQRVGLAQQRRRLDRRPDGRHLAPAHRRLLHSPAGQWRCAALRCAARHGTALHGMTCCIAELCCADPHSFPTAPRRAYSLVLSRPVQLALLGLLLDAALTPCPPAPVQASRHLGFNGVVIQYVSQASIVILLLPVTLGANGTDWSGMAAWTASNWVVLVLLGTVVGVGCGFAIQVGCWHQEPRGLGFRAALAACVCAACLAAAGVVGQQTDDSTPPHGPALHVLPGEPAKHLPPLATRLPTARLRLQYATWHLGAPTVSMFYGLRLVFTLLMSRAIMGANIITRPVQVGAGRAYGRKL